VGRSGKWILFSKEKNMWYLVVKHGDSDRVEFYAAPPTPAMIRTCAADLVKNRPAQVRWQLYYDEGLGEMVLWDEGVCAV